jgi:hypothetical protein
MAATTEMVAWRLCMAFLDEVSPEPQRLQKQVQNVVGESNCVQFLISALEKWAISYCLHIQLIIDCHLNNFS